MRWLIAFSFLVFSSGAFAFDGAATAKQYDEARAGCRQSEMNGQPIGETETAKQCDLLNKLGEELKAHDWCWNNSEVQWYPCKQTAS